MSAWALLSEELTGRGGSGAKPIALADEHDTSDDTDAAEELAGVGRLAQHEARADGTSAGATTRSSRAAHTQVT
jgi:hypothetical protein